MSQMVTRKGPVGEDKDKRQTDSPVKEMKKKLAANAEKEKQATEKNTDKTQSDKKTDKVAEKQNDKKVDKVIDKLQSEKKTEKVAEKPQSEKKTDKVEKVTEKMEKREKTDKSVDKKDKTEKSSDVKEVVAEKKETDKAPEKKEKVDKKEPSQLEKAREESQKAGKSEAECSKPKSKEPVVACVANVASIAGVSNGVNGDATNGDTVSSDDDDDRDEMFPELAYDDSDGDFEPPTPEGRSYTRRSQVKSARTPETPRPASDKRERDDDSKVLKLKEDAPSSDRKLRSSGSPKPDKKKESPKKNDTKIILEEPKESDIPVDVDVNVENEERVKVDTNYSRSRVKVSPYRRLQEDSSLLADYTGNNSTMEMDITESSWSDTSYLSGLRSIRGRRSYKAAKDTYTRADRTNADNFGISSEVPIRPTGTVVGRKRRPEGVGTGAEPEGNKRARLVDRLTRPFRLATTTIPVRGHAEIVGINTDLPLTAPLSSESFDPEALKCDVPEAPQVPRAPASDHAERDGRKCVIM